MMRVVIVQEYIPGYRSPFFTKLRSLAADESIEVIVAAGSPNRSQAARGDATAIEGVRTVTQSEQRILGRRLTVRDIEPAIRDAHFVVLEQARRNVDAYRMLARRRRSVPIALWGHGRDYTHRPAALDRAAYNWLTRRADWFFAYTAGGKEAVASLGYPEDRITMVQNSIDTTELAHAVGEVDATSVAAFAQTHDLRGKTALFVGGLDKPKRLPFLLEAARRIGNHDPEFRLLVAGAGDDAALISSALPHFPWLKYLGAISGREKALALASSQVIAMPGRVGLVAVDSFAAGTPIVTTDWPWHAPEYEYLRDGTNAVVSLNSAEDYADQLRAVLNDASQLARLRAGATRERDRYTIDSMARRYLDGILRWREAPRRA